MTVLTLLVAMAAGCSGTAGGGESVGSTPAGGESSSGEKVTVSILSWFNEAAMKPVMDEFIKENPNVTFDFQYAPPVKDYVEKLKSMMFAGTAPDIVFQCYENKMDLVNGNYLVDLTGQPFIEGLSEFNRATYTVDGKIYSFGPTTWVGGLIYNVDMFEEAGITAEPQTWEQFLDVLAKLKAHGVKPLIGNVNDAAVNIVTPLYANETLSQDAAFDEKLMSGEKTFAEGWTKPLQMFYEGLVQPGYLTGDMLPLQSDQVLNEFINGNVAIIQGGTWTIKDLRKKSPEMNVKMMPVPGESAGTATYFGASDASLAINSKSKNKEIAMKFLEFVASPKGLELYFKGTGNIITAQGYVPEVDPSLSSAYEGMKAGNLYIPMGGWTKHTEALRNQYVISLQDMVVGKITPQEAAESMDKKFNELEGN
ncbi:ABC transporter substrate-binding protein [Paenibacillus sp.]|uniref:ABC transporter substrate-binding protein n=1 Tax=Paenibacillus sp. TaxID=58172 RepID=UPI002D504BBB|nr:extracellular solute-binding protein [Paenibacillus sp.]HZG83373.1 extracellular solute-binding protein [Paenibacillus sp.]